MKANDKPAGFTLVELLVVIGLIALLIGILVPTLAIARQSAGQAACASNLRQWTLAANLYAIANHNFLPRRGQGQQPTVVIDRDADWFNALPATLRAPTFHDLVAEGRMPRVDGGGPFVCPQANNLPNGAGYLFTYGMNMRLSTWLVAQPDRIDRVGSPATLVFMADAPSGYGSVLPFNAAFSPIARHRGRVNLSFLDGHVAAFSAKEVGCNVGDPDRFDVRWKVPGSIWSGPVP